MRLRVFNFFFNIFFADVLGACFKLQGYRAKFLSIEVHAGEYTGSHFKTTHYSGLCRSFAFSGNQREILHEISQYRRSIPEKHPSVTTCTVIVS